MNKRHWKQEGGGKKDGWYKMAEVQWQMAMTIIDCGGGKINMMGVRDIQVRR